MNSALQAENAQFAAENAKMSATLRVHDQLVHALHVRIAKLQKLAFGKTSEKVEREFEQLELAFEDLLVAVAEDDDAPIDEGSIDEGLDEPIPEEPSAPGLRRRPRVSDATLRERRNLDPGTCCPDCGGDLHAVGEDLSELLDMIAAQMKVIQIARIKKSCRHCEKMVQEPAPSRPIPGSMAGPNLLTHVLVSNFEDHLPLYRQHEIFVRMGADIPESTLVGWCGRAMKTLSPLLDRIEAAINGHGRELHYPVLSIGSRRNGRKSTFSAIWPMPAASCKRMATTVMQNSTSLDRVVCPVCAKQPVGPTCDATSMISGPRSNPILTAMRSTGSRSFAASSAT